MKHVCRSSLLSGRNVRWPRRMLPPGESRWVVVSMPTGQTNRRTDARPSLTLSAGGSQRIKKQLIFRYKTAHVLLLPRPSRQSVTEFADCMRSGQLGANVDVRRTQVNPATQDDFKVLVRLWKLPHKLSTLRTRGAASGLWHIVDWQLGAHLGRRSIQR